MLPVSCCVLSLFNSEISVLRHVVTPLDDLGPIHLRALLTLINQEFEKKEEEKGQAKPLSTRERNHS